MHPAQRISVLSYERTLFSISGSLCIIIIMIRHNTVNNSCYKAYD